MMRTKMMRTMMNAKLHFFPLTFDGVGFDLCTSFVLLLNMLLQVLRNHFRYVLHMSAAFSGGNRVDKRDLLKTFS